LCAVLGALLASPQKAAAHPLHTTFTDVAVDPVHGGLRLTIRVFADDFRVAASKLARTRAGTHRALSDSVSAWYVSARVQLLDARGRRAPLVWGGVRRDGETLQLTLYAPSVRSMAGARVGNGLMVELFDDQINIVRVERGERRSTLLFTKRDAGRMKVLAAT
jgi:hypothetical protein